VGSPPTDRPEDDEDPILNRPNMRVALQEMSNEITRLVAERDEYRQLYHNMITYHDERKKEAGEYWSLLKDLPGRLQEIGDILGEASRGISDHQKNNGSKKQIGYALTLLSSIHREVRG